MSSNSSTVHDNEDVEPDITTGWQGVQCAARRAVQRERGLEITRQPALSPGVLASTEVRFPLGTPLSSRCPSIVDYLYLAQLPRLLFANDTQQEARSRLGGVKDAKQMLLIAIEQIAPVRNEIAHVREVSQDRLMKASVACGDVLGLFTQAP